MEMSFLGSIGHLMAGSGIKEMFELIYAPKAVEQIMSGKAISRAVRAHLLLDAVLNGLLLYKSHCRIQRGVATPPPLIFKKRWVTSVTVVISTVSTMSEQERNGTGRAGVTFGSQSTSVRPLCS